MKNKQRLSYLLLVVFFALTTSSQASDVNLPDCEASSIDAAIAKVRDSGGGTIYLPVCDKTFSPIKGINLPFGVSLIGSGVGKTILREVTFGANTSYGRVGTYTTEVAHFSVYNGRPVGEETKRLRLSFRTNAPYIGSTYFILHDIYQEGRHDFVAEIIRTRGLVYNYELNVYTSYGFYIFWDNSYAENINSNACKNLLGTSTKSVFFENVNFHGAYDHPIDGRTGAHWVLRNSIISNDAGINRGPIEGHGPTTPGTGLDLDTGTNAIEVYDSTISKTPWGGACAILLRSGCGAFYNNTIINSNGGICMAVENSPYNYPRTASDWPVYHQPSGIYVWNMAYVNSGSSDGQGYGDVDGTIWTTRAIAKDRDYFLRAPSQALDGFAYTAYPYPHPARTNRPPRPPTNIR